MVEKILGAKKKKKKRKNSTALVCAQVAQTFPIAIVKNSLDSGLSRL